MRKYQQLLLLVIALIGLAGTIDLDNLPNYAGQSIPNYINDDNNPANNPITDIGATLGRVLFYDKQLSTDASISCASCHLQQFAFGDTAVASLGVNGRTGRHAMRLVNARFSETTQAFWDERAASFEIQSTQPIQDHIEMGFSGTGDDPDLDSLIRRMEDLEYYPRLFEIAFGDPTITEERMQLALAQFVRSIQSFDSKFDEGRAQVNNDGMPFPNFTNAENQGKMLFLVPPDFDNNGNRIGGGTGCGSCHRPPEFDINGNSRNNGVISSIEGGLDITNTRSPSLRDLVNPHGQLNGPLMHNGAFNSLMEVIEHYNDIPDLSMNPQLDNRLRPMGNLQNLQMTDQEKDQLLSFLLTLTGSNIYEDEKWSDPFDNGELVLLPELTTSVEELEKSSLKIYPNPASNYLFLETRAIPTNTQVSILSISGQLMYQGPFQTQINVSHFPQGCYQIRLEEQVLKFIKL
ncbi:MAG: cytochrome c peroxidase [Bacteroidota bacterium]